MSDAELEASCDRMQILRDIVADLRTKAKADPSMPLWDQIGMSVLAGCWVGQREPAAEIYDLLVTKTARPTLTVVR